MCVVCVCGMMNTCGFWCVDGDDLKGGEFVGNLGLSPLGFVPFGLSFKAHIFPNPSIVWEPHFYTVSSPFLSFLCERRNREE